MNRLPSVKTLERISGDRARELRAVLEIRDWETLEETLQDERYPRSKAWRNACYHRPSFQHAKLVIADEILGTYGVEYIQRGNGSRSPSIEYCNTGDTYAETLLAVHGSYRVGDWGSIVELGNYA